MLHGWLTIRSLMSLGAADNRVYDGEVASQFLAAFARHMANPYSLFQ